MNINYNNLNSLTFEEAKEIFINRAIMPNGFFNGDAWRHAVRKISDMLESGELQELKTGHWIKTSKEDITECMAGSGYVFMCSECKTWENHPKSFCPNCGARMDEPLESEEET